MASIGLVPDSGDGASPLNVTVADRGPLFLDRTTATEAATDALRQLILSGAVAPGVPLRQDELARQLGVSRTPLREALHRLTVEGLIRLDHHKGAVAATPSIAELKEIYELQEILECHAVKEAIKNRTDESVLVLRSCIEDLAHAKGATAWIRGNLAFHEQLYRMSGKTLIVDVITQLRNRASLYINMVARSEESRDRAEREHEEMVDALVGGDSERLEGLIKAHLRATLAWVEAVIDE